MKSALSLVTVVGARPQFVKAAAMGYVLRDRKTIKHTLIHTGQHYDHNMAGSFFSSLELGVDVFLSIGGMPSADQIGWMILGLKDRFEKIKPDVVLLYGDTNSTLAGAIVASKLDIPIIHVEAGVRLFDRTVPEEINRVITDGLSDLLVCSSSLGEYNLIQERVFVREPVPEAIVAGDVMLDSMMLWCPEVFHGEPVCPDSSLGLGVKDYYFATIHRPSNTDDIDRLTFVLDQLNRVGGVYPVLLPLHPRTRKALSQHLGGHSLESLWTKIRFIEPVSYTDCVMWQKGSRVVITDSGGMQKEAYWVRVPCVTVQPRTEWVELVEGGYNRLTTDDIVGAVAEAEEFDLGFPDYVSYIYGDGTASTTIVAKIEERYGK